MQDELNFPGVHLGPEHFAEEAALRRGLAPSPVIYRPGTVPLLVTSVHGFSHLRNGAVKQADGGTFALSSLLALVTGAHWLAVGQPNEPDSNFHPDTVYKQRLARVVREVEPLLVVDIHAANAMRPFDVDVGSLNGESWGACAGASAVLKDALRASQFLATENAVFSGAGLASGGQTVSAYVWRELRTSAIQLEISCALTSGEDSVQALHAHAKLTNALVAFLRSVAAGRY